MEAMRILFRGSKIFSKASTGSMLLSTLILLSVASFILATLTSALIVKNQFLQKQYAEFYENESLSLIQTAEE